MASDGAAGLASGHWVLRAAAGGVGASSAAQIPQTQLFLTGGDTTVRGYARNAIGVPGVGGTPIPGRFMATASAEWQFPLHVGSSPGEWQGAVFMDSGAVANRIPDLTIQTGSGAGLRWRSPVGPLHIDLARAQHTGRWRLHLNVGFVF
jgi:translocation and assembly module TamA